MSIFVVETDGVVGVGGDNAVAAVVVALDDGGEPGGDACTG